VVCRGRDSGDQEMSNIAPKEFYAIQEIDELMRLDAHLEMICDDIDALSNLQYGDSMGDAFRWIEMSISNFRFVYEHEINRLKELSK